MAMTPNREKNGKSCFLKNSGNAFFVNVFKIVVILYAKAHPTSPAPAPVIVLETAQIVLKIVLETAQIVLETVQIVLETAEIVLETALWARLGSFLESCSF